MKNIKHICLLILVSSFIILNQGSAQPTNTLIDGAIMTPPNAASLGKYIDIPVELSRGIPQISIPIHTLTEGNLSLPVSLSYHASGIKVAETASWVGTNWTLQAGGMVSRTVMGIPDEWDAGFYFTGDNLNLTQGQVPPENISLNVVNELQDGEADIFSFSFPGYSGKFYIKDDQVIQIPQQDLKIYFNSNNTISTGVDEEERLQSFTIVTPTGELYYFGEAPNETGDAIEYVRRSDSPTNISDMPVTWLLMKIQSPDKVHEINFTFVDETYGYMSPPSMVATRYYDDDANVQISNFDFASNFSSVDIEHFSKRLSTIETNTEFIDFIAISDRDDTKDVGTGKAKMLDSIKISSGLVGICKKFALSYSYYESTPGVTDYHEKRLRLNSVQESSCNDDINNIPAYTFEYNGNEFPGILSRATDHWGFYNGQTGNENQGQGVELNIPPTTLSTGFNTVTKGNSNRETYESYASKGILTKITYPTGGHTQFDYESNSVHSPMNMDVIEPILTFSNPCVPADLNSQPKSFSTFSNVKYRITVMTGGVGSNCPSSGTFTPTIKLYKGTDISTAMHIEDHGYDVSLDITDMLDSNDEDVREGNLTTIFPSLQLNTDYIFQLPYSNHNLKFEIFREYTESVVNRDVGGLRIKQITHHDNDPLNDNDIVKTYEYIKTGATNESSGNIYNEPEYGYVNSYTIDGIIDGTLIPYNFTLTAFTFVDNSFIPLSSYDGYHILYNRVIEKFNGNGS
ncbi:MAG: hypothetical protein AAFO07_31670, partial [Bacteroidota bacterium]